MKKVLFIFFLLAGVSHSNAQEAFSVSVIPSAITAMPAVHSGAFAEWDGKWIILGGRKEGLHNFQSGMAFSPSGRNDSVFVVDPVHNVRWAADLHALPVDLFESLCSSNMEFYRDSSTLYMMGGFGRQNSTFTWTTFPTLTAVDLSGLSGAVINGTPIAPYFRQVIVDSLAVAGGNLEKIDSTYYLVFGHRFEGIYTHNGPPLFTQHYTTEIRKFTIHDDGTNLGIANYTTVSDTDNFHRRDYNLIRQIYPNGNFGFTAFGGVFQKEFDVPYLSPIDITQDSAHVNSFFNQNLNQYQTAAMPVYDSTNNFMHTIFFGGMSFYTYDDVNQVLVRDSLVPFVNTISKVSRDGLGNLTEYSLPVQMPSLLGTNARFIPNDSLYFLHRDIVDLNLLSGNTKVGWIVSGIQSDLPNVADIDPASLTRANNVVYDVYIDKSPTAVNEIQVKSSVNDLMVYPNPSHGIFNIEFSLVEKLKTTVMIFDEDGKRIASVFEGTLQAGPSKFLWDGTRVKPGTYLCRIKAGDYSKVVKMILAK